MKKVLSILLALAMVAALIPAVFAIGNGTESFPYFVTSEKQSFPVAAGETVYIYVDARDQALNLTVDAGERNVDWYLNTGKVQQTPSMMGVVEYEVPEGTNPTLSIVNTGSYDLTVSVVSASAAAGTGTRDKPAELIIGENTAPVPASDVYYYTWTASDNGTLTLTMTGNNWWFCVIEMDTYKYPAAGDASYNEPVSSFAVTAGYVYQIQISTSNYAADTVVFTAAFSTEQGGSSGGETGSSGTMDDPAALVIGENVAPVPAGMDYYYYSWTATDNGTLTITMTGDDYYWKIDNMTAFKYGDANFGDVDTETISVSKDDLIYVCVSTYSGNGGNIPFTAEFTPGSGSGSGSSYEPFGITVDLVTTFDEHNSAYPEYHTDTVNATGAGTITVTIAGDPGYWFTLYYPVYPDGGSEAPKSGSEKKTYTFDVTEAGVYTIQIASYNPSDWNYASGKVSYELSFTPGDVETEKPAYIIKDDVITQPGTYDITMEYAHVTIVPFTPDATGVYQITAVSNGVIGNYGGSSAYIFPSESVEHGVTLEWTCQQVGYTTETEIQDENFNWITVEQYIPGQTLMLGIKPASEDVASVQIVIEKIGEYTPVEIPTVTYENKAELKDFTVPEGATIGDYVNVYDEQTHTAVPGADGYFHLDSADGPILLVDLDYLYHLADALNEGRGTMFVSGTDENGNPVRFDIGAACKAYDYVSDENGYYPLTIDLMFFYKEYGAAQGVYSWALEEDPQNPGYNPDSAWMFACLTMTLPEDESSKTGESFHMGAVIAALALSAAACAAVVTNKKRFF